MYGVRALGYSSIETTAPYTHVQEETLKCVLKTYHPRGNALYAEVGEAYRATAAALKKELLRKWQNLANMKGAKDEQE